MAKKALSPGPRGHATGQAGAGSAHSRVDWVASLARGRPRLREALHWRLRHGRPAQLWLVLVDASASTRRGGALRDAKGVLASVFEQAYRQRARLALLAASGQVPVWGHAGQRAGAAAQGWLAQLGSGGGTPLAEALALARRWLARRRRTHPHEKHHCLVLTDARVRGWAQLQPLGCDTLLLDLERGAVRLGRGPALARALAAQWVHLDQL